jgi:diaminohydroxyphosphoribosylaminopyrimidine deaminase / 5-amino-6-(5-phosphoribosylamino)uracil reductase
MTASDRHEDGGPVTGGGDPAGFMDTALRLAERGLGNTWPNPSVGCVILRYRDGLPVVLARGWTQPGGRPHAETMALDDLARRHGPDAARGAIAFVSLEPCSHYGRTPPCADALIAAGVGRVVVACEDPDPRVSGRGIARLRDAGIEVVVGVGQNQAELLNSGFFQRVRTGRPAVHLKIASSLDGRVAARSGHSQWITGAVARAHGHLQRACHNAILIGLGTAVADDPLLTCRLPGMEGRSPVRIVLDSRLRLPLTARLVADARNTPTWLIVRADSEPTRLQAFRDVGVEVIAVPVDGDQRLDMAQLLQTLGERGLTRILVEGGPRVATTLIAGDLVDEVLWYRAPMLVGGDGVSAIGAFGLQSLAAAPRFERSGLQKLGDDWLETYRRCGSNADKS